MDIVAYNHLKVGHSYRWSGNSHLNSTISWRAIKCKIIQKPMNELGTFIIENVESGEESSWSIKSLSECDVIFQSIDDELGAVERLLQEYEIGHAIFNKLFKLTDSELKDAIAKILVVMDDDRMNLNNFILSNNPDITRSITNMIPDSIGIHYYDSLLISAHGIYFKKEHKDKVRLVPFNRNFSLEN
jgi:hypothetical protein